MIQTLQDVSRVSDHLTHQVRLSCNLIRLWIQLALSSQMSLNIDGRRQLGWKDCQRLCTYRAKDSRYMMSSKYFTTEVLASHKLPSLLVLALKFNHMFETSYQASCGYRPSSTRSSKNFPHSRITTLFNATNQSLSCSLYTLVCF